MIDKDTRQFAGGQSSESGLPSDATASTTSKTASDSPPGVSTSEITQKLSEDFRSSKAFAKQEIAAVTDKAKDVADDQKNFLASRMAGIAEAVEKVAEELEGRDNRDVGRMTRNVGSSMRKFSESIQDRSIGEVAAMAEDFGRKQPLAFLGIAAIAGLAASRFLTASAPSDDNGPSNSAAASLVPKPMPIGIAPSGSEAAKTVTEGRSNG
jgi:ElaB/YqjD/DUF883 family membrane-anchored ribosome-binding protein